mgnify:CR=1 FL=1
MGRGRAINGDHLGRLLSDHHSLRLAVVEVRNAARVGGVDPAADVAEQVVRRGVPAAVYQPSRLRSRPSLAFLHAFYDGLAAYRPIDVVMAEARRAIQLEEAGAGWGLPHLVSRLPDGQLFERYAPPPPAPKVEMPPPPKVEPPPPAPKAEPKPPPKPPAPVVEKPDTRAVDIALKAKQEQERKRKEEQERVAREEAAKAKLAEEKRKQDDRLKAEAKERERRQQQEVAAMRAQLERETAMRDQAAREQQQRQQQQLAALNKGLDDWTSRIRSKIKGNVIVPPDIAGNPEAIFDVVQLPTGEIIEATLRKSSGNRAYDEAVQRAILKSSPLPRPDRPELFQRVLNLRFRPLD